MNAFSKIWLKLSSLFDSIQYLFNGNFWEVFSNRFGRFEGMKVLDLACGTGELIKYLKPKKYLGIDINLNYLNFAKKRFKGVINTEFKVADITAYVPKERFDVAFIISTLHHLSDRQINQTLSCLKKAKLNKIILVDGYPYGLWRRPLAFLDSFLAGGYYFRDYLQIQRLVIKYFKIKESGEFNARNSFYRYPFLILEK